MLAASSVICGQPGPVAGEEKLRKGCWLALTASAWKGHPRFPFTVHWLKESYGPTRAARESGKWEEHLEHLVGPTASGIP